MNGSIQLAPEFCYYLDNNISLEKIRDAKRNGNFLVAKVLSWDFRNKCMKVYLGNNIYARIPLEDLSLYKVVDLYDNLLPAAFSLIGKNVCACVKSISNDNKIILSRRENMLKAFDYISQCTDKILLCSIIGIVDYGVFLDAGHGIYGFIHRTDLSASLIKNPSVIGFQKKDLLNAKVISVDIAEYKISLNYKSLFNNLSNTLSPRDIIGVITLDQVNEKKDGYFVYLNPNTRAIMNVPKGFEIPYGSHVIATVLPCEKTEKVRLNFLSFV